MKPLEGTVLKTICAFASGRDGGTLLIGVADDGKPCGLAADYASLRKPGQDDKDLFQLHLIDLVTAAMGAAAAARLSVQVHSVDGADVCRMPVQPSPVPVEATITVAVREQLANKTAFFVRPGNSSRNSTRPSGQSTYWDAGPDRYRLSARPNRVLAASAEDQSGVGVRSRLRRRARCRVGTCPGSRSARWRSCRSEPHGHSVSLGCAAEAYTTHTVCFSSSGRYRIRPPLDTWICHWRWSCHPCAVDEVP